jgi:carbonic anhydrase/acetyltransferase-like protein (isoleucine patch superfamily)
MGAIVMDGVVIESNSIVAAGSVVLEGTHIEANSIYAGIPAKKVKDLPDDKKENLIKRIAEGYPQYGNWYD